MHYTIHKKGRRDELGFICEKDVKDNLKFFNNIKIVILSTLNR